MSVEAVGVQLQPKKETGGGGKAVASALIPGLGQFMDGRNKEGAGYLAGGLGSSIAGKVLISKYNKDVFEASSKASKAIFDAEAEASSKAFKIHRFDSGESFLDLAHKMEKEATQNMLTPEAAKKAVKKGGYYAGIALGVLGIGLWIANIVDAYRGGKKNA